MTITIHLFDTKIAKLYGVNAAILLYNIAYWSKVNEANGNNFYDGHYWTYNSRKAYSELFPYLSERQIKTALDKLIDDGVIITGVYNEYKYDRTMWYALTDKGKALTSDSNDLQKLNVDAKMSNAFDINVKCIPQKCQMDIAEMSNGNSENVRPIPDIIPNKKPNVISDREGKTKRFVPPSLEEVKSYCLERGNGIDAQHFIDYYTANGWKVGKNPMKDWKATVRTWERNGINPKEEKGKHSYDLDKWEKNALTSRLYKEKEHSYDLDEWEEFAMNFDPTKGAGDDG